MNKQQRIETIEKELALLKAESLAEEANKFWEAKDGEEAWIISPSVLEVHSYYNSNDNEIEYGCFYETKEIAEQALALQLCEQRLKKAIYIANGNKVCPFVIGKQNYLIFLCGIRLSYEFRTNSKLLPNWFYCKDKDAARKVLAENREDLILWLSR